MNQKFSFIFVFLWLTLTSYGQMTDNGITKYGNEWQVEGQDYYKIRIGADGFFKVDFQTLQSSGFQGNIQGNELQLFKNGVEVPIFVTNNNIWGSGDYLTFHGYYNKSEIDRYSFQNGTDDIVNPKASLYSDSSTYFLTMSPGKNGLRVNTLTNDLTNVPSPEPYIIRISELDFKEILNTKTEYSGLHPYILSGFYAGKGMVSSADNQTYNLPCPGLLADSKLPIFRYRGVTNAGNVGLGLGHDLKFSLKGQDMFNASSSSPRVIYVNFSYSDINRVISADNNQYSLTSGHSLDKIKTGYVAIEYPASTDIDAEKTLRFYLEGRAGDRYLALTYSGNAPQSPYLTDSTGIWRIPGVVEGNTIRFKIRETLQTTQLIYRPSDLAVSIQAMHKVKIKTFDNFAHDYIILSHSLLLNSDNGISAVEQYAAYRRSASGGNYDVAVVDINDLYNSFGYGLDYNPMAVKNFANYLGLTGKSRFLFIIGRGRDYKEIRTPEQLATAISRGYGVPSFGDYGSDNLLVSKSFHALEMNVAVGRLPAVTQEEVLVYLNKIKLSDAAYNAIGDNPSRQWLKTIVQVNGGNIGKPDQFAIANAQKETENIIKASKIAGIVETFIKGSNETIGKASDDFFKLVNQGVSVVDYFGHGALSSLEYPIDLPSKYDNNPRLPILIIKGCKTGNCQRDGASYPAKLLYDESYKNAGFRAVVGSIADSDLHGLSSLATQFYTLWGSSLYGKTFGELFQATFNSPNLKTSQEGIQQLYIGDPALYTPAFPGPDFIVKSEDVETIPKLISSLDHKFTVRFNIKNLGTSTPDTLFYRIIYENGNKKVVSSQSSYIINPKSENEVYAEFDLDKSSTSGENSIYITLDPDNKISESPAPAAELNNEYTNSSGSKGFKFFIQSSLLQQVYPYRYAIFDTNAITLSGYSQSLKAKEQTIHWAIDTTASFNSPLLRTHTDLYPIGHIEWTPGLTLHDNIVYYWRISRDSISPEEPALESISSFTYLPGKKGFSQSHNDQFREDNVQNAVIQGGGNNIQFGTRTMIFSYTNGIISEHPDDVGLIREGVTLRSGKIKNEFASYPNGILALFWYRQDSMLVAIPPNTTPYGSLSAATTRSYLAFDPLNVASRKALINFIENVAADGDILTIATFQNAKDSDLGVTQWQADSIDTGGKNIFNVFEKYGAHKVRSLLVGEQRPYTIAFTKKNGVINEEVALDDEVIVNSVTTLCHSDYNYIEQTFGPAHRWDFFELLPRDSVGRKDTLIVELTAIHKDNPNENYIFKSITTLNPGLLSIGLSALDASSFPYIKVKIKSSELFSYVGKMDGFDYFRLTGMELPEATLLHNTANSIRDTINQGEPIAFSIESKNIGSLDMDSLLVNFSIRNQATGGEVESKRYGPLKISSLDTFSIDFNTKSLQGDYLFLCEMNPNEDQPEAYHGNNSYLKRIFIQGDVENPLVDVTFDGQRIINGDIVSSKPLIKISIRDENKLFPLDDPSLFNLYLVNSFGNDTLIPALSADLKFTPADPTQLSKKNEAIIEYTPNFLTYPPGYNEDGQYSIRITAKDKAGNQSGKYDYEKSFRIINKKSISDVFNYPNPFSNATRFVFTLTGYEQPTYYRIQIMTVSGKMVREITQDQLGPLKIGKHLTDYVWDGTDEFGDKLANGVYLYRFIVKDQNQKDYEHFTETNTTKQYFDGEWGKLVIIR